MYGLDLESVWECLFHSCKSLVGCDAVCGDDDTPHMRRTCNARSFVSSGTPVRYVGSPVKAVVFYNCFLSEIGQFPCDRVWKSHSTRSCPLLGIMSLWTEQTVLMSRGQISEGCCCRKTLMKFTKGGYFYFSSKLCMSYTEVY